MFFGVPSQDWSPLFQCTKWCIFLWTSRSLSHHLLPSLFVLPDVDLRWYNHHGIFRRQSLDWPSVYTNLPGNELVWCSFHPSSCCFHPSKSYFSDGWSVHTLHGMFYKNPSDVIVVVFICVYATYLGCPSFARPVCVRGGWLPARMGCRGNENVYQEELLYCLFGRSQQTRTDRFSTSFSMFMIRFSASFDFIGTRR